MNKFCFTLLAIIFVIIGNAAAQPGIWTPRADMPVQLWRATAFVVDEVAYVGTGGTPTGFTNCFWRYDPALDYWDSIAPMPDLASDDNFSFPIDGTGYVGGLPSKHFWRYDPAQDQWTQLPDVPTLTTVFESMIGFSCGGKGYYCGLFGDKQLQEYDPITNAWTSVSRYPGDAIRSAIAVSTDSLGFVGIGAGRDKTTDKIYNTTEWYAFDPRDTTWTRKADFPGLARNDAIAFRVDSTIYVGMGISFGPIFNTDIWAYDIPTDTWSQVAEYPLSLSGNTLGFAFGINGKGYVGNDGQDRALHAFDPLLSNTREPTLFAREPLRVSPNPTAGTLFLDAPDTEGRPYQLYDSAGRAVATGRVTGQRIDVAGLPAGVYALAVETAAGARVARIVRE